MACELGCASCRGPYLILVLGPELTFDFHHGGGDLSSIQRLELHHMRVVLRAHTSRDSRFQRLTTSCSGGSAGGGEMVPTTHSGEVVHLVPERHRTAVGLGTFRAPALFLDRRNAEARVLPVAVLAHDAAAAAGVSHSAPLTLSPPPRPPRPVRARRHAASWAYRLSSIAPAWALPQAPHQRCLPSSLMPKVELLRAQTRLTMSTLA